MEFMPCEFEQDKLMQQKLKHMTDSEKDPSESEEECRRMQQPMRRLMMGSKGPRRKRVPRKVIQRKEQDEISEEDEEEYLDSEDAELMKHMNVVQVSVFKLHAILSPIR